LKGLRPVRESQLISFRSERRKGGRRDLPAVGVGDAVARDRQGQLSFGRVIVLRERERLTHDADVYRLKGNRASKVKSKRISDAFDLPLPPPLSPPPPAHVPQYHF
jgi:hypothetical protein